jgi:hypothetical protein
MVSPESQPNGGVDSVVELAGRLLFSMLRSSARLAARFDLPMERWVELAQLAYFQEIRQRSPRDMGRAARRLGVSLRTAGSLNKKLRGDFLVPELEVKPLRDLTNFLLDGPRRHSELAAMFDADQGVWLERSLHLLTEYGWLEVDGEDADRRYALKTEFRSFVSDDLNRRIDGLDHQLDILVSSVQERFVSGNDDTARARSWFFAARDQDVPAFIDQTVRALRHGAIDLEESALNEGPYRRYGVTLAITPVEEKP